MSLWQLNQTFTLKNPDIIYGFACTTVVSAEQLRKNTSSMKSALERLEKDIESFSKTKDKGDKFSEVMSISFISNIYYFASTTVYVLCNSSD